MHESPRPDEILSPRERDVLKRVAAGRSNMEIAEELFLSINTVETYIRTAYRAMGVTSRTQAMVWAIRHGILTAEDLDLSDRAEPREPRESLAEPDGHTP